MGYWPSFAIDGQGFNTGRLSGFLFGGEQTVTITTSVAMTTIPTPVPVPQSPAGPAPLEVSVSSPPVPPQSITSTVSTTALTITTPTDIGQTSSSIYASPLSSEDIPSGSLSSSARSAIIAVFTIIPAALILLLCYFKRHRLWRPKPPRNNIY